MLEEVVIKEKIGEYFPGIKWKLKLSPQQTIAEFKAKISFLSLEIWITSYGCVCECSVTSNNQGIIIYRIDCDTPEKIEECLITFKCWLYAEAKELKRVFGDD